MRCLRLACAALAMAEAAGSTRRSPTRSGGHPCPGTQWTTSRGRPGAVGSRPAPGKQAFRVEERPEGFHLASVV